MFEYLRYSTVCKVRCYPLRHVLQYVHECPTARVHVLEYMCRRGVYFDEESVQVLWKMYEKVGKNFKKTTRSAVARRGVFLKFLPTFSYILHGTCTDDEKKLRTRRQAEDSTVTSYVNE